jgi:hypothetical protein
MTISHIVESTHAPLQPAESPTVDLQCADCVIASIQTLRAIQIPVPRTTAILSELKQIRELLCLARENRSPQRSGKIIYLSVERWLKTGQPGSFDFSNTTPASAIFWEALATHPILRAAARDKIAAVIRELDLAIFELERRTATPSLLARFRQRRKS